MPLGRLALVAVIALRTVSGLMAYFCSVLGLSSTRTAGNELPPTLTVPTPLTCDSFCARLVEAASYIWPLVMVSEVSARIMIGESAGFTLRYVGLLGKPVGSRSRAALIAACT